MQRNKKPPLKKKVSVVLKSSGSNKVIPVRQLNPTTSILKLHNAGKTEINDDEFESWMRTKTLLKPTNQLDLTHDELKEEISRVLTSINPQIASNLVEYSHKDGTYIPAPSVGNMVELVNKEALCFHKDSEEAKLQTRVIDDPSPLKETRYSTVRQSTSRDIQTDAVKENVNEEIKQEIENENENGNVNKIENGNENVDESGNEDKNGNEKETENENENENDEEDGNVLPAVDEQDSGEKTTEEENKENTEAPEEVEDKPETEPEELDEKRESLESETKIVPVTTAKKILNQFNFGNQASLTYNNHIRDFCLQTIPPPRDTFYGQVTQWIIFDAYEEDYAETQREKAKENDKSERSEHKELKSLKLRVIEEAKNAEQMSANVLRQALNVTKMTERIINQNTYDEIAQACRYWDDPADEFQDTGNLLPLWKFTYERTKKHMVTSLCWNPRYHDIFAATFGSFDLRHQTQDGVLCMFTLKNPSYPEYVCFSDHGMMCVDIHSSLPHLFVVGTYNGDVAVYNMMEEVREPQHKSNIKSGRHGGVVAQVKWDPNAEDGVIAFYSIGGDGCVFLWTIMKFYLVKTTIIVLDVPLPPIVGPDGTHMRLFACGTSFAFHPSDPLIFLAGSQEGAIYKCSTAYCSSPLTVHHHAHTMTVNKIQYNPFSPDIYISCSPDTRIKIWEDNRKDPLFVFEIGASVVDVEWSPYSSTVFCAAVADGRVFVFDISVNIYEPICVECDIARWTTQRFTKIAFNRKLPFILVGNDKGRISSLKLSPNLRKKNKPPKKGPAYTQFELEVVKLRKILLTVCEPPVLKASA